MNSRTKSVRRAQFRRAPACLLAVYLPCRCTAGVAFAISGDFAHAISQFSNDRSKSHRAASEAIRKGPRVERTGGYIRARDPSREFNARLQYRGEIFARRSRLMLRGRRAVIHRRQQIATYIGMRLRYVFTFEIQSNVTAMFAMLARARTKEIIAIIVVVVVVVNVFENRRCTGDSRKTAFRGDGIHRGICNAHAHILSLHVR